MKHNEPLSSTNILIIPYLCMKTIKYVHHVSADNAGSSQTRWFLNVI